MFHSMKFFTRINIICIDENEVIDYRMFGYELNIWMFSDAGLNEIIGIESWSKKWKK